MYRRLSDTAALHAAGKASLWRDPDLQLALDWRAREQPTEQWAELYGGNLSAALSFIDESKLMADRAAAEISWRRWNRWFVVPGSLMLLAVYVLLLNAVSDSEALKFLPWFLRFFIEPTLPALPVVLVGLGLTYAGKRAHRALVFPRILTQVPELVARRQASVDRQVGALASARNVTATEALGTNYAGFWARALGYAIDSGIGMALFIAVVIVFAAVDAANWPVPIRWATMAAR